VRLDFAGPGLWYATRATGLVTLLLLTASVLLGILTAGRFTAGSWPRFLSQGLHRNVSLLVLVFLTLHVGTTVLDTYTSIPLAAAFVPFASGYKPAWLSLGAVALDLLAALVLTSLARRWIGHRYWRTLHWLAYACWPVAVAHGLGIGTDREATWVLVLSAACVTSVLCLAGWRMVTAVRAPSPGARGGAGAR
jgi:DMSO/TMAO reductase YedYZ heme-binding membrane subunit